MLSKLLRQDLSIFMKRQKHEYALTQQFKADWVLKKWETHRKVHLLKWSSHHISEKRMKWHKL